MSKFNNIIRRKIIIDIAWFKKASLLDRLFLAVKILAYPKKITNRFKATYSILTFKF